MIRNKIINRNRIIWLITFLLIGCVFSMSICSIFLGGKATINNFYNVGDVYEVRDSVYRSIVDQESGHQEINGKVVLDEGAFRYSFPVEGNKDKWNFFCFELDGLDSESTLQCNISFEKIDNEEMVAYFEKTYQLEEGMNVLDIPKNLFNVIVIRVYGGFGTSFYVKSMQFRKTAPSFSFTKAAGIFGIAFCIYCIFVSVLILLWKRIRITYQPYGWIDILQSTFIGVNNEIRKILKRHMLVKIGHIRTLLFLFMFIYNVYVEISNTYSDRFKYHLVFYVVIIFAISILSVEDELKKISWNNALVWSWLVLWIMASISDFFVPKNYSFLGYVMVFVIGFFFFVWNNMQDRTEIVREFTLAVHFFFALIIVFCVIFRPEIGDFRYSGISKNPSVFALYLAIIWAVVLGEFEQWLRSNASLLRLIPFSFEGCLVLGFLWKSQSACPILCVVLVSLIWFLKMVCGSRTKQKRRTAITILLVFLILEPSYIGLTWGLKHISSAVGQQVVFEGEISESRQTWGMVANAAGLGEALKASRLAEKFAGATISDILSGRDCYYRAYLRNMNLLGHKKNPIVWGHRRLPHNAILGIAYRYGVFACVPYILMLILTVVKTFRYSNRGRRYSGVPFYICLTSIAMSMADNVEQPFVWLPWIAMYLMMGICFSEEK